MSCSKFEPLLAGKLFGDLNAEEEKRLDAHLALCGSCRGQLAELHGVLAAAGKPVRPHLSQHFWDGYWHRLIERMEKEPAPARWQNLREAIAVRWSWGWQIAAAAAVLVIGIVIGQNWSQREPALVSTSSISTPALMPAYDVGARTAQLLERSKILLIGIVNDDFDDVTSSDLMRQRKVSRSLLQETRALQASLSNSPDRRLQQLLQQLELVLVQIANLEIEHDLSSVELVREGIDRKGLLLKINIEELSRATQRHSLETRPEKGML